MSLSPAKAITFILFLLQLLRFSESNGDDAGNSLLFRNLVSVLITPAPITVGQLVGANCKQFRQPQLI